MVGSWGEDGEWIKQRTYWTAGDGIAQRHDLNRLLRLHHRQPRSKQRREPHSASRSRIILKRAFKIRQAVSVHKSIHDSSSIIITAPVKDIYPPPQSRLSAPRSFRPPNDNNNNKSKCALIYAPAVPWRDIISPSPPRKPSLRTPRTGLGGPFGPNGVALPVFFSPHSFSNSRVIAGGVGAGR